MGPPPTEKERGSNERQHRVVLTEGFWLADTTCTQALWEAVMGVNPSWFKGDLQNPVEHVSWNDITEHFMPKLNQLVHGINLELPTGAQWEYACRAGTTTPYSWGEQITPEQVNHAMKNMKTVPVKALPKNEWGLYQMHGNVWEWCIDGFGKYLQKDLNDLVISSGKGHLRMVRGGCWSVDGKYCRASAISYFDANNRDDIIGFRLARQAI